jgi:hypothetical protein
MMRYLGWVFWLSCCLLVISACALMGESVQQHSYVLVTPKVHAVPQPLAKHLWPGPVHVKSAFAGQLFVHRLSKNHFARDQAHVFLTPPGQQLSHVVADVIKRSGLAQKVLRYGRGHDRGVFLKHDVTELYIDDRKPGQSAVVVAWHVELSQWQDGSSMPQLSRSWSYHQRVLVQDGDQITAMNTAVAHIMRAMLKDLSSYLRQQGTQHVASEVT